MYGEKTGNCPPGRMEVHKMRQSLPGYDNCGTIQVTYHIPPGTQVGVMPYKSGDINFFIVMPKVGLVETTAQSLVLV